MRSEPSCRSGEPNPRAPDGGLEPGAGGDCTANPANGTGPPARRNEILGAAHLDFVPQEYGYLPKIHLDRYALITN